MSLSEQQKCARQPKEIAVIIPRRFVQQKYIPIAHDKGQAAASKSIAKHYSQSPQPHADVDAAHEWILQSSHPTKQWKMTVLGLSITHIQLASSSLLGNVNQHAGTEEHSKYTQGSAIYRPLQPACKTIQIAKVMQLVSKADFKKLSR